MLPEHTTSIMEMVQVQQEAGDQDQYYPMVLRCAMGLFSVVVHLLSHVWGLCCDRALP